VGFLIRNSRRDTLTLEPFAGICQYMKRWATFAVCLVPLFVVSPAEAQSLPAATLNIPQVSSNGGFDWGFSTGFDYVTGKYGVKCALQSISINCTSTGTTAFDVPATAMLQFDRLRLELTVPYVDIEGPGKFAVVLGVPVIVAPANNEPKHRSGLGDITVDAAWIISREDAFLPRVELAGVVKLPTAGDGLGTGKTDYGAQVNLYRTLLPGLTAFGSLGYQWVGDLNTIKLHSGARAAAGADFKFLSIGGGAMLDYRQSAWQGAPAYFALDPYVTWRIIGGLGVSIYTTIGLTRSSPSQGFGVRLTL
jgi:hypothetical protein